jgi:hypothetical protein
MASNSTPSQPAGLLLLLPFRAGGCSIAVNLVVLAVDRRLRCRRSHRQAVSVAHAPSGRGDQHAHRAVTGIASLYKSIKLGAGGTVVARELGGTARAGGHHRPGGLQRLRNIVEEMAIASGLPVPRSMCSGRKQASTPSPPAILAADAAIAVTRGALQHLDRDELQGVIGARVQPHPQRRHAPQHPPDRPAVRAAGDRHRSAA